MPLLPDVLAWWTAQVQMFDRWGIAVNTLLAAPAAESNRASTLTVSDGCDDDGGRGGVTLDQLPTTTPVRGSAVGGGETGGGSGKDVSDPLKTACAAVKRIGRFLGIFFASVEDMFDGKEQADSDVSADDLQGMIEDFTLHVRFCVQSISCQTCTMIGFVGPGQTMC